MRSNVLVSVKGLSLFLAIIGLSGFLFAHPALAQTTGTTPTAPEITFEPEVPLPTFLGGPVTNTTFADYIRAVFVYFIWSVGALAVVMVIWGGIKWVTAAGNPGRINDARDVINNAMIGLVIALTSIVLLNLISPRLTRFQGLTLRTVDSKVLEFSKAVIQEVGSFSRCPAAQVGGKPEYVGSSVKWEKQLNSYINQASAESGVDRFLIKAIILQESPKRTDPENGSSPFSGPTTLPDGTGTRLTDGSLRRGSAYGIGQFISTTLLSLIQAVNGSIPADCPANAMRQANGSLVQSCQTWLDNRLQLQVRMMARYLQILSNKYCVNGDLGLTAAGYHVGEGDLKSYCEGGSTKNVSVSDITNYVSGVKNRYTQVCAASPRDFNQPVRPPL